MIETLSLIIYPWQETIMNKKLSRRSTRSVFNTEFKAKEDIAHYIGWYSTDRGRSSLVGKMPKKMRIDGMPTLQEVA